MYKSDGPYVVCVKLTDAAGNVTIGKSATITRDTVAPILDMGATRKTKSGDSIKPKVVEKNGVYRWQKLSGEEMTISPVDSAKTSLSADKQGEYKVRLSVMDRAGNSVYGDLNVEITPDKNKKKKVKQMAAVFKDISAGEKFSCGIDGAGAAYCWGKNKDLGTRSKEEFLTFAERVNTPAGVRLSMIRSWGNHVCASGVSGDAYCWGKGISAQPAHVSGTENVSDIWTKCLSIL